MYVFDSIYICSYDLLGSTGGDGMKFEKKDGEELEHVFVVQATKSFYDYTPPQSETWSEGDVYTYLVASMQGLRNIGCNSNADSSYNDDGTLLLAHRLTAIYKQQPHVPVKERWELLNEYIGRLVQIFDILKSM